MVLVFDLWFYGFSCDSINLSLKRFTHQIYHLEYLIRQSHLTTSAPSWRGRRPNSRDVIWNKLTTRDLIIYTVSKRERGGERHAMPFTGLLCAYAEPPPVVEMRKKSFFAFHGPPHRPRWSSEGSFRHCLADSTAPARTPAADKVPAFRPGSRARNPGEPRPSSSSRHRHSPALISPACRRFLWSWLA
jgi:hypothetical protein